MTGKTTTRTTTRTATSPTMRITTTTMRISNLVEVVKDNMKRLATAGLFSLFIGGKPVPAGRPRVARWGVYYPKTYTKWMTDSWKYVSDLDSVPTGKNIALLVECVCPPLKTSKATAPMGDVDNFANGPMDLDR